MAQSSATASPSASVRCFAQRRHHDLLLSRQERAFRAYLAVEERGARATDRQFHRVAALLQTLINDGQRALLVADAAAAIGTDDRTSRFAPSGLLTVASGIMALYHRLAADDDGGQPAMDDAPWIIDADAATAATPDEADDDDDDDDDDTTPTPASVSAWTAQRAAAAATAAPVKPASPRPTAAALAAARSPSLYGQPVTPVSDDDDDARTPRASAFPRAKPRGASDGRLPSSLGVAARTAAAAAPLGPAMVTPPQEAGGSAAAPHGGSVMGTLGGFLKQRIWPGTSPAAAEAPLRSPAAHRV
ncbi:hypothetical protein CXG81DRAFT_25416 [Caulochytrium protostelioides]|uniref:Uncharacterized protein n=1 Tax=Caulochytrium protostelioides TaxID=1555241 RepID=A0A4P9X9F6_9FUNG|nr:hypothetical protein CXG81DRAFT_25416 [Caulochytrium protostelioides]|eukprot:RKP01926.1 hypothetical protein CXG81DRAFT_25416 [Caulochytrium protostelioides]